MKVQTIEIPERIEKDNFKEYLVPKLDLQAQTLSKVPEVEICCSRQ